MDGYRATVFGTWYNRLEGKQVYKILSVGYGKTQEDAQAAAGGFYDPPAGVQASKMVTARDNEPELDPWDVFNQPLRVALEHARAKREMEEKR